VLTREILLEKLWDSKENFVEEHTLTLNISRLRAKLDDENNRYIKTIYGIGYKFSEE
jgi:DNA-binding response OmpR family regulator